MVRPQLTLSAAVGVAAWLCSLTAVAAPIQTPDVTHLPALTIQMVSARSGKVIQTSRVWVEPYERDGEALIAIHSKAARQAGNTIESRVVLRAGATLRCLEEEHHVRAGDGETLAETVRQFRADALPFAGQAVPDDTYAITEGMFYLLGYLPMDGDGAGSFHVLGMSQPFKVEVRRHGAEDVSVPAGRFLCDHLRMRLDAESFGLPAVLRPFARLILPEFDVWIARAPPRLAVRLSGPFGPPDDRDVFLELGAIDGAGTPQHDAAGLAAERR
jgi:hypothetical protein